ncbi:MAG: imidazole glycerol phosphate synthase subunit HisF [Myxococcota bacterium]|nr:imidazole glycerol phosphate synthase subunit HisF [Myxococcota bacterium]
MLTVRIIPCLDCRDGRVVKGVKFQGLRDAGNPAELAQSYELQGADEIVLLDVSATPQGRANQTDTVKEVRNRLSIPLTVGGGVRKVEDAARLLGAGADKVGINTAAVDNPDLINEIAERFGCQCTVIAIDAAWTGGNWEVVTLSGKNRTGIDAIEWAKETTRRGAGEILLTSWDRDGTRSGYDLNLLSAVSEAVNVPVIASGGADSPQHMVDALKSGAHAVLAASIFHDGDYTVSSVKDELTKHGIEIRK